MDRPLGLLLALLAASAPIAAVAQDGLPGPFDTLSVDADADDEPGVTRSDDGRTVRVADEALPAPTGWFLVTVSPTGWANLTLEETIHTNGSHSRGFGYAPYLQFDSRFGPDPPRPRTYVQAHGDDDAAVSLQGHSAGCCPLPAQASHEATTFRSSSGSSGFDTLLHPDDSLTVGLMASEWTHRDDFRVRLTADDAPLEVEDIRRGTNVTVVDLVDEAQRNGTAVQVEGRAVASDPGTARVTADLPAGGLVHLDTEVEGEDQAQVRASLPDGTVVDNGDGRNISLQATALTAPGTVEVTLENLEEDSLAERASSPDRQRDHRVEADLVVADIAPADQGLWEDLHVLQDPEVPDDVHSVSVDDAALPGADGWFVKEITAPERTEVVAQVRVNLNQTDPGPQAVAPLLVSADEDEVHAFADERDRDPVAAANAEGQHVGCCPLASPAFSHPGRTSYETLEVGPNASAYVGLAAVDWGEDDRFHVRLHPRLDEDGPLPVLDVASVSNGTDAEYVDLVDAAARNGTNAEAFDRKVAGEDGSARFARQVDNAGLVSLSYRFSGSEARGLLDVTAPDGTTYSNGDGRNVHGYLVGTVGSGALEVELSDLQRPSWADRAQGGDGWAYADLFYADVELPQRGVQADHDPVDE